MTGDSDVIVPYSFKPDGLWSSSEESDIDDSAGSQVSFTARKHIMVFLHEICAYAVSNRVYLLSRVT